MITGIILVMVGVIILVKPKIFFPRVVRKSGKKVESFQIEYSSTLTRILAGLFILFGILVLFNLR